MCGQVYNLTIPHLKSRSFWTLIIHFVLFQILIAVGYAAWLYRKDPNITDNYSFDIFNHEKAKRDLIQWKKQLETWDEGEALERVNIDYVPCAILCDKLSPLVFHSCSQLPPSHCLDCLPWYIFLFFFVKTYSIKQKPGLILN